MSDCFFIKPRARIFRGLEFFLAQHAMPTLLRYMALQQSAWSNERTVRR
jgi:hypothetical protein